MSEEIKKLFIDYGIASMKLAKLIFEKNPPYAQDNWCSCGEKEYMNFDEDPYCINCGKSIHYIYEIRNGERCWRVVNIRTGEIELVTDDPYRIREFVRYHHNVTIAEGTQKFDLIRKSPWK